MHRSHVAGKVGEWSVRHCHPGLPRLRPSRSNATLILRTRLPVTPVRWHHAVLMSPSRVLNATQL
jgi:hypothetical protein